MNANEYLSQIELFGIFIEQFEHEVQWIERISQSDLVKQDTRKHILQIKRHYEKKIQRKRAVIETIINQIQAMPKALHSQILYERYINGVLLYDIAAKMNYSEDYIKAQSSAAHKEFEALYCGKKGGKKHDET